MILPKLEIFAALALTVSVTQWMASSATLACGFAGDMVEAGVSGGSLTGESSMLLDQKFIVLPVIGLMPLPPSS